MIPKTTTFIVMVILSLPLISETIFTQTLQGDLFSITRHDAANFTLNGSSETNSPQNFSLNAEADFCSRYYYKGIALSTGAVFQPGASINVQNFTAGVWSSFSLNRDNIQDLDELDVYMQHDISFDEISISNKLALYLYPGIDDYPTTGEYILNFGVTRGEITGFTEFTVDLVKYPGAFIVTHGISGCRELHSNLQLEASLSFSWAGRKFNSVNYGIDKPAINYMQGDLNITYSFPRGLYLKPHLHYIHTLDKELQETGGKGNFFFGLTAGYTI
jgi:hypothetical protein